MRAHRNVTPVAGAAHFHFIYQRGDYGAALASVTFGYLVIGRAYQLVINRVAGKAVAGTRLGFAFRDLGVCRMGVRGMQ